jgi:hypothetical protein
MSERSRLTAVAEVATIIGTLVGIAGLYFTLHAAPVLQQAAIPPTVPATSAAATTSAATPSSTDPASTERAAATVNPVPITTGTIQAVAPTPSARLGATTATSMPPPPPTATHIAATAARGAAQTGLHITWSRQEKTSIAFAFGYVAFFPLFGFVLGLMCMMFGVQRLRLHAKLIGWTVAGVAPQIVAEILIQPPPSNAFEFFIVFPIEAAYGLIGTFMYISALRWLGV